MEKMNDDNIERVILYYIIFENYECDVTEDDFCNITNKKIIRIINNLKKSKEEISILSIQSKIIGEKQGVSKYLATLGEFALGTEADNVYKKLISLTKKRRLYYLLSEKLNQILIEDDIDQIENEIEKEIQNINKRQVEEENFKNQIINTTQEIEKTYNKRNDYSLYTGINALDNMMLGLHEQELTIIGARPGVGKTTFALQVAETIAEKGIKVLIVSLEMSSTQLITKLISKKSKINSFKMRSGNLKDNDFEKILMASNQLTKYDFEIVTNCATMRSIENKIRKSVKKGARLVVIDYIQLIKNNGKFNCREQEVADITRTLKLLTLELNIPIIGLCQLNRNAVHNEPTLADLRESGSIEQDADNVIFLYNEEEQQENTNIQKVTLKIAKQRAGMQGKIQLKFYKGEGVFVDGQYS